MKQTHLLYGIILGIFIPLLGMVEYLTDTAFATGVWALNIIPVFFVFLLNAIAYSRANNANVTYGSVFMSCLKVGLIGTALVVVWDVIQLAFIPGVEEWSLSHMRQMHIERHNMTPERLESRMKTMRKIWPVYHIAISLFFTPALSAICSLIAAAIARKDPQPQRSDSLRQIRN